MMKKQMRAIAVFCAAVLMTVSATACGSSKDSSGSGGSASKGSYFDKGTSSEDIIKAASAAGKIGNWGIGNEYELLALLTKYDLPNEFVSQAFAEENPNTVAAFISASMKGWEYACENPDEAAEIVFNYGSSVSPEHQKYMASEVAKLVTTDMSGNAVGLDNLGQMEETAMQQTLDLAKQYIKLDDSAAAEKLGTLTLDDVRDTSYWEAATSGSFGTPEKTDVTVQLKWLPQAQFMGYYVALDKGYYNDVGLNVTITPGGGDISETTAVYNGTVDFGVTWFCNLISADAAGMGLTEVAQVYQRSGLELVYKLNQD